MPFTKHYKETAKIYAPDYPTDIKSIRAYTKQHKITHKQYEAIVRQEVKDNKALIAEIYKKDANREAQKRFREKNQLTRYVGSINVEFVFERKDGVFEKNEIIPFDKKISKSNITNEIINIIENKKIEKMTSMDYRGIININTGNYTTDIAPIKTNIKLNNIRMRESGAGLIDGYDKQEWDTNTGKCVFDYIISRYGDIKGFKTVCTYWNLQNIFNDEEDNDLLKIGVNTTEIERFCKMFKIPMYAIDDNEKTFHQYCPENRNKKCPAMIFRLSNKHFYPVMNKNKVQSIIQTTSLINNVESEIVRDNFKIDDSDDIKDIKGVQFVDDAMETLAKTIKEGKIPKKLL